MVVFRSCDFSSCFGLALYDYVNHVIIDIYLNFQIHVFMLQHTLCHVLNNTTHFYAIPFFYLVYIRGCELSPNTILLALFFKLF